MKKEMSTNSRIGILLPHNGGSKGSDRSFIRSIYCHWDGYPSHMGMALHQSYGTVDLVSELLDKGDARLINSDGNSEHFNMHSEGGQDATTCTFDHFMGYHLEEYNYIAVPVPNPMGLYTNVEWVMQDNRDPSKVATFTLVVNELLKNVPASYNLTTNEVQKLYMDRNRIQERKPDVLSTVQCLYDASVNKELTRI